MATQVKLYIAKKNSCLVLDPETGETIDEFRLPPDPETGHLPDWGYIGVYEDYLIAGADFVPFLDFVEFDEIGDPNMRSKRRPFHNFDITSSKRLVVMDRHTGKVFWTRDSKLGFRHNAIVAGNNKVFCIDTMPDPVYKALKRRAGQYRFGDPALTALDIRYGNVIWRTNKDAFGTWLGYSEEHDILIQSGRKSRDMMVGEPDKGVIAYRGKSGKVLWSDDISRGGPYILHGDTIITDRYAYSLLTGEQKTRIDPLTGEETPWAFQRNYGCNYAVASEHLLTFRSAAAGFYDLMRDGGTGNFGGFKSSCTSNLVVANGVLNAPDYTRTCSCSYQNQASLAMVHMPDAEIWTDYSGERERDKPIRNVGINFGAPGDRRADNGSLWLEYPIVGGPSPAVPIKINSENHTRFYQHSSGIRVESNPETAPAWVVASGIEGISSINITLAEKSTQSPIQDRPYTVRLYFSEPHEVKPGQRIFDVTIQGQQVLENLDIAKVAGGTNKPVVREFKGILVKHDLALTFASSRSDAQKPPLICGIEMIAEGW